MNMSAILVSNMRGIREFCVRFTLRNDRVPIHTGAKFKVWAPAVALSLEGWMSVGQVGRDFGEGREEKLILVREKIRCQALKLVKKQNITSRNFMKFIMEVSLNVKKKIIWDGTRKWWSVHKRPFKLNHNIELYSGGNVGPLEGSLRKLTGFILPFTVIPEPAVRVDWSTGPTLGNRGGS